MMQQVNLYPPDLRPQRDWLNAKIAALATIGFVALMLLVQLSANWRAHSLAEQIQQRQTEVAQLQAQVDQLQPTTVAATSQTLDQTISQLEKAIADRQKVGRIISGQNMGNAQGFHASMQSLARESRDDLSLHRFTFSRGGNYVEMHGEARDAKAVPLYLQRLKGSAAFAQARFGLLSVSSERANGRTLEFSLGYENVYQPAGAGAKR